MQNLMNTAVWNRVIIRTNIVVKRANEANESDIIEIWIIIKDNIFWQHELRVKPKQLNRMVHNIKVQFMWILYTPHQQIS